MDRTRHRNARMPRSAARGYTIVEVLGVATVIAILIGFSLVGFSSALRNADDTRAENDIAVALDTARDLALASLDGKDTAAVFAFEPGGRVSVITCREIGNFTVDETTFNRLAPEIQQAIPNRRIAVFVPDSRVQPTQLPRGVLVRGLATSGRINAANDADEYGWYSEQRYDPDIPQWVLPETGFYDPDDETQGTQRHTFMIRYEGGSARPLFADDRYALIYLPTPGADYHEQRPWRSGSMGTDFRPFSPANLDHARFVRRLLNDSAISPETLNEFLGDVSSDTVLARPVAQIAAYRLDEVVALVRDTGTATPTRSDLARFGSMYILGDDFKMSQTPAIPDALRDILAEQAILLHAGSTSGPAMVRVDPEEGPSANVTVGGL